SSLPSQKLVKSQSPDSNFFAKYVKRNTESMDCPPEGAAQSFFLCSVNRHLVAANEVRKLLGDLSPSQLHPPFFSAGQFSKSPFDHYLYHSSTEASEVLEP